jgi:hypothetical protein
MRFSGPGRVRKPAGICGADLDIDDSGLGVILNLNCITVVLARFTVKMAIIHRCSLNFGGLRRVSPILWKERHDLYCTLIAASSNGR